MIASASTFARNPGLDRPALTPAEQEVLTHLLVGSSNKEIASALNKAEPTVKHQVSSILRKHRVPSHAAPARNFALRAANTLSAANGRQE